MSPEQWYDARSVGPASDVYALGVLAFETLTGSPPFQADNSQEYFELHCDAEVPPLGDGFPAGVDRVIRRALAKLPASRYPSALDMAKEVREAFEAQPQQQLQALARVWDKCDRSPGLLMHGGDLLRTPTKEVGELAREFLAASYRGIRITVWHWRSVAAGLVAAALAIVWYIGAQRTNAVEDKLAEAELEQGRSALVHHEPDAQRHLTAAYHRDPAPSTGFMLARAVEPRLAEQARFASSFGRMWSAAYSPDGKQVVTTDDQDAQVWDVQSLQRLFVLRHGDIVYDAVYSADGHRLVTGCGDGAVRIWDAATGALLRELRHDGPHRRYYAVALSRDETRVAGLDLGVAHVWDAATGAPLAELRDDAPSSWPSLAFSADDQWLAMSTGDSAQVFATRTWERALRLPGPGIHRLRWDPTGPRLVIGTADGDVSIWAVPSGERVHHLRELGESVNAVAYSPDGRLVAAGSEDGAVQMWDAASARLVSQGDHLHSKILSIEFDRTSSLLVASGASGAVAVTDAASGLLVTMLDGPTAAVGVAHFAPSSRRVLGASWDGTARIWDATAPYRRWSSSPMRDDCGLARSLEPDRRFLAVACRDRPTRIWDTARDQLIAELPGLTLSDGDFPFVLPAVSVDGDRAAVGRDDQVEVYDLPSARVQRTVQHRARVHAIAFAGSGRDLISGAIDGSVIVTRENGSVTAMPASPAGIDAVAFLPDGRVVVADARPRLRIYDLAGAIAAEFELQARVATLRMSADGRRLVTVPILTDKVAAPELWDVEHYHPIARLTSIGQGQASSARFITNDQVVTACGDGTIRRWGSETGQLQQTYRGGSRFMADATLSADGTMLIGGGGDGQLRFWEASSGRPLWSMPAHRPHLVGLHVEGNDIVTRGFSGDLARWSLPASVRSIEACEHSERCAIVPP
jgi:WD40 repeat protein